MIGGGCMKHFLHVNICGYFHTCLVFTRLLLLEGSSLQVEILSVCLSVIPSSLQHFQYKAFKSSQNHVRPHILYITGKRRTSAMTMTMTKTHTKTYTTGLQINPSNELHKWEKVKVVK